jgi:hypothetical protein
MSQIERQREWSWSTCASSKPTDMMATVGSATRSRAYHLAFTVAW